MQTIDIRQIQNEIVLFIGCQGSRLVLFLFLLAASFAGRVQAQGTVTFGFSGFIQYQQAGPVAGLSLGDTFQGSFTFDPHTTGVPHAPADNTLDTDYWTILSWSVTIPTNGLTFSGSFGEVSVGNNAPWYASDRYIVTMFPNSNQPPVMVSGHQFAYFQIDLFAFGNGTGAQLLANSLLPVTPPDMALVTENNRTGRFVFTDASFQNQMTSLTSVPEPPPVALAVLGILMLAVFQAARERRNGYNANQRLCPVEVDALKRLQAETAAELDALLPAILDKAFKGEL